MRIVFAPRACQNCSIRPVAARSVSPVGVTTTTRPSNRSGVAWVAADELRSPRRESGGEVGDDLCLRAARVGDERIGLGVFRCSGHVVRDPVHGRADHDEVRGRDAVGKVGGVPVDHPGRFCTAQGGFRSADADDTSGHAPDLRGQPDRPADQADADDGEVIDQHVR
jgi:hypothetical protein